MFKLSGFYCWHKEKPIPFGDRSEVDDIAAIVGLWAPAATSANDRLRN